MKSRCEARLSEKLNKGRVVMDETMPEARHQMKDHRQRSTASGSSVISFDYRLDQLKKVIYFLAANDAYENSSDFAFGHS
jgi:bisphosphoglycerate-independent phosphoglycerate mutase (AlkP superfamily)